MKHDVQSALTAPGFRCENERRAAHMSAEDDMRSSVEESSDLAPPPAV